MGPFLYPATFKCLKVASYLIIHLALLTHKPQFKNKTSKSTKALL